MDPSLCMTPQELYVFGLQLDLMIGFVSETFIEFISWRGQSLYFELTGEGTWCPLFAEQGLSS